MMITIDSIEKYIVEYADVLDTTVELLSDDSKDYVEKMGGIIAFSMMYVQLDIHILPTISGQSLDFIINNLKDNDSWPSYLNREEYIYSLFGIRENEYDKLLDVLIQLQNIHIRAGNIIQNYMSENNG